MDNTVSLGLAVVGVVELIKRLFDKDFRSAAIIAGAGVIGAVVGPQIGIPWIAGLIIGLQGSGLITAASYLGAKKPATTPVV